ncbi:MAG TPA: PAS domain-containing protein [Caulobacteraceae bacterium]
MPASGLDFEFTLDRDWRITSISEAAAAWSGSTPDDLIGRSSREVWPPEPRSLTEAIEAAFAGGPGAPVEQPSLAIPGRWVRVDVEPSNGGARIRFEDITSRIGLGPGPAEVILVDRNGVIVAVNAAWRAGIVALGLKLADADVGARYATVAKAIAPRTDEVAFRSRLEELFAGRIQEFEATFSQDGSHRSERRQVRITPLRSGDATYFLAVHEDLAERARILGGLHRSADRPLPAEEKERERIASELHETVGQNYAAMKLGLARLRKSLDRRPAARSVLDDMSRLVEENVHHARVLSYLTDASGRRRVGLQASVRRLVQRFGRQADLAATFVAEGPLDAVSAAAQHAMFRVAQEALSNVYRHARATSVSVTLVSRRGALTLRVADDGRGLRRARLVRGAPPAFQLGIAAMRARVEQLGGTLTVVGGRSGTKVRASIPLRASGRTDAGLRVSA